MEDKFLSFEGFLTNLPIGTSTRNGEFAVSSTGTVLEPNDIHASPWLSNISS